MVLGGRWQATPQGLEQQGAPAAGPGICNSASCVHCESVQLARLAVCVTFAVLTKKLNAAGSPGQGRQAALQRVEKAGRYARVLRCLTYIDVVCTPADSLKHAKEAEDLMSEHTS